MAQVSCLSPDAWNLIPKGVAASFVSVRIVLARVLPPAVRSASPLQYPELPMRCPRCGLAADRVPFPFWLRPLRVLVPELKRMRCLGCKWGGLRR
jgi:hypothetical protein